MQKFKVILNPFFNVSTLFVVLIAMATLFVNGCASVQTREMALEKGQEKLSLQKDSICFLSVKTDNKFKPEWPPEVWAMELTDQKTNKKINIAVQSKSWGSLLKKGLSDSFTLNKGTSSWEGLVSFELPQGKYRLSAVRGGCNRGIGIGAAMASFDFPFDIPFQVYDKECVYLGRIEMTNRERTSDKEIPSGDTTSTRLPQQHSGFGTGTFDVKIFDNMDEDIHRFKAEYPVLDQMKITKRILPPWSMPTSSK